MDIWDKIIISNRKGKNKKVPIGKSNCPQVGIKCPRCKSANLQYDGKLNLFCPACGYESAAGFT